MSNLLKGITVHEGYNDLGTFEVDITDVEQSSGTTAIKPTDVPSISRTLLFKLKLLSGKPIPLQYRSVFTVKGLVESEWVNYEQYPNVDGYIQINTPVYPVVVRKLVDGAHEETVIRMSIEGPLDERDEEMYIPVVSDAVGPLYTLIWDLFIDDGHLKIYDGSSNYYELGTDIEVGDEVTAIHVTTLGVVYGFDGDAMEWTELGTIEFARIEFPENLISYSDGFYMESGTSGTIDTGNLGSGVFADYTSVVLNPGSYYVDVTLNVYLPGTVVYTGTFTNLMPGSTSYTPVIIDATAPTIPDTSPTLDDIQTISGITFSSTFADFLSSKDLGTVQTVRKAGPITYIEDYPTSGIGSDELAALQGHVDLYTMNQDLTQNQRMIDTGYGDMFKIANTPKDIFLNVVVNEDLPLFRAAQIHETAVQNQKLVANLLAGTLADMRLANPAIPPVEGSTFAARELADSVSSCGCDDCKSAISPFAYMMDLIKYGAAHIDHTATTIFTRGGSYTDFITVLTENFLQPFGTLNVDCETLHDEFCRVRLVTEVLEAWILLHPVTGIRSYALTSARNQYLTLVYKSILLQAGTSINEVRDVFVIQNTADKLAASQKLANKLSIPLYIPTTSFLCTDALWFTIGNTDPNHELTAIHLEEFFGFRDTQRNVLTNTPVSYIEEWKADYLRSVWKTQDYLFSDYSREDIAPATDASFKDNWKPIIDPDIIGWEDMTYLYDSTNAYPLSDLAKALWANRKQDTDDFLQYCLTDSTNISRTSADINARILKVTDRNIVTDVIDGSNNNVQITADGSNWTTFSAYSRVLNQTDTDVILKKATDTVTQPAMFQPYGTTPKMRYKRVVNITGAHTSSGSTITFNFTDKVITDGLASGYARLQSTYSGSTPYATDASAPYEITNVVYNSNQQVTLSFSGASMPDANFLGANLTLVYEVEVPLYTTQIVNPCDVSDSMDTHLVYQLFSYSQNYAFLSTISGFANPLPYTVWDLPSGWNAYTSYSQLLIIYNQLAAGTATQTQLDIITDNLHMDTPTFNKMMDLFIACEKYLAAMYSVTRPTDDDLYSLASILWTCARKKLRDPWVKEEARNLAPLVLQLSGQYFWISLQEPVAGIWDARLQTLNNNIPIIDPELLNKQDMLTNIEAQPYITLYDQRVTTLQNQNDLYLGYLSPFDVKGFNKILNDINSGSIGTSPYNPTYTSSIAPYTTLAGLLLDLRGPDVFKQKTAADALWAAFAISKEDFLTISATMDLYLADNPLALPAYSDLKKTVALLTSGYKRMQLYPGSGNWVDEEQTFVSGNPIMYYNVIKMRLAADRANPQDRANWQKTLIAWNRYPTIQPDIVPAEDIIDFVSTNWVYTAWNARRAALNSLYADISAYVNASFNAGTLLANIQDQVGYFIGRLTDTFSSVTATIYYPYFSNIAVLEAAGEDIRPYLAQLGIAITEYRYLINIINVLTATSPTAASPLIDSEYSDVINILIAIHSRTISFDQVNEEYAEGIVLDQDYFQVYKPALSNYPLTNLPATNAWRSPQNLRNDWEDDLQSRIDREAAVKSDWQEVLKQAEDQNMPLLRNAIIYALANNCESLQSAAERLAKTFFIETEDNCCVKHTRVSFAIETLQGFIFALQNGIYDSYVSDFTITAPDFNTEWQWLGSYNTWRSAVFVFLYPENLLYPTLKRLQSPKFIELSDAIQNATTFTPQDACDAAKEFDIYYQDICGLQIICSTNTNAEVSLSNPHTCCGDNKTSQNQYVTYFFGVGQSKKLYYSSKVFSDNSKDAHGFWEEIPLRNNNTVLGCFTIGNRYVQDGWGIENLALWLFYTFWDNGELKLAYITKDLTKADSVWTAEVISKKIPSVINSGSEYFPAEIIACQNGADWLEPCFLIRYEIGIPSYQTHTYYAARFSRKDGEVVIPTYHNVGTPSTISVANSMQIINSGYLSFSTTNNKELLTTIRQLLIDGTNLFYECIVAVFPQKVFISGMGVNGANEITYDYSPNTITGAFESKDEVSTILILYKDPAGINHVDKIFVAFTDMGNAYFKMEATQYANASMLGQNIKSVLKTFPLYSQGRQQSFIATQASPTTITGAIMTSREFYVEIYESSAFALLPEKDNITVNVESAECIGHMNARANDIEAKILNNISTLQVTATNNQDVFIRTTSVKEFLNEAYYFMPMLLALDQQNRGQYQAALSWYRSVYDYTSSLLSNRKIFYGLVLEETIGYQYIQAANWLLDPLNPHLVAQTRANAYTKYTLMNIVQCFYAYADQEFTLDTIETIPVARKLYTTALDLLKVAELYVQPNQCQQASHDCLTTATNISSDWATSADRLMNTLQTIGDPVLIESLSEDIATLLNEADDDTYPAQFAAAYALINENRPPEPDPQDIGTTLTASIGLMNDAYRYVLATDNLPQFTASVADEYARAVAGISGLDPAVVADPASADQIAWLTTTPPDNSQSLQFAFATSEGVQFLQNNPYDPFEPRPHARQANLVFHNPSSFAGQYQVGMPVAYTPILYFAQHGFCMPQNPVYQSLDLKGNLELYKIFNCRNIAGMVRELDVYSAATDSVTGMPVIGASGNLVTPAVNNYAPSQYRFSVLIERAKMIGAQAQQMESLFLAALEKKDAANYDQLKATQDLETARATVTLQDLRITQANDEKDVANLQLDKITFTRDHYQDLSNAGLNSYENSSLSLLQISAELDAAVAIGYGVAAVAEAFKDSGVALSFAAQAISSASQTLSLQSSILSQLASYERRQQDWQFQATLANYDISIANEQIKVSDDNIQIVTQEREIAQINVTHAQDSLEFLKNKFTNAELYTYMSGVLGKSYNYLLNLSTSLARTAERQLYFERQQQAGPFILKDYWQAPSTGANTSLSPTTVDRQGLTGSARLLVDITKLDEYAFDTNKRKLQMTKVISLAQNFPSEFQQFRETGVFNFSLTNKLFDYDFPGHYLRLINSVKTTVVGLLPVYDQVKATLTADTISYTVIGGTTFQKIPIRRLEVDSVALTSANNATGLFDLQPAQSADLIRPFEGMGIESRWELKMPQFSNRFDFNNIADVLLTVEYTALEDYEYQYEVLQQLENKLTFNRGFSFKNDFPDQWYELAQEDTRPQTFSVTIQLTRDMFPQGINDLKLNTGENIVLYFARADGFTNEIKVYDFNLSSTPIGNGNEKETVNGKYQTDLLMNSIPANSSPLLSIRLSFDNKPENRSLFTDGSIKDILLIVPCKAELKNYPL